MRVIQRKTLVGDRGLLRIKSNRRVSLLITTDLSMLRLLAGNVMRVLLDDSWWVYPSSFALSIIKRVPMDGLKDRIRLHLNL